MRHICDRIKRMFYIYIMRLLNEDNIESLKIRGYLKKKKVQTNLMF